MFTAELKDSKSVKYFLDAKITVKLMNSLQELHVVVLIHVQRIHDENFISQEPVTGQGCSFLAVWDSSPSAPHSARKSGQDPLPQVFEPGFLFIRFSYIL